MAGDLPSDSLTFGTFHHIGVATDNLHQAIREYSLIGYSPESAEFADPQQGISGQFVAGPGPRLELLEALPGSQTLAPWLRSPARMYHLAFEVPDLPAAIERSRQSRAKLVREPTPAVAFDGRPVAFLFFPGRFLVEFIQATA